MRNYESFVLVALVGGITYVLLGLANASDGKARLRAVRGSLGFMVGVALVAWLFPEPEPIVRVAAAAVLIALFAIAIVRQLRQKQSSALK
jgi:uncharacterized membrane protein HdeD (DUF308 family)